MAKRSHFGATPKICMTLGLGCAADDGMAHTQETTPARRERRVGGSRVLVLVDKGDVVARQLTFSAVWLSASSGGIELVVAISILVYTTGHYLQAHERS